MSEKFITTFFETIPGIEAFVKRGLLDVLPPLSRDEHGNESIEDVILCHNGSVLPYTLEERRQDLDRATAASGGDAISREYVSGTPIIETLSLEETFDLGNLPSPLQMRCNEPSSVERSK